VIEQLCAVGVVSKQRKKSKTFYYPVELNELPAVLDVVERARRQSYQHKKQQLDELLPLLAGMQKPGWQAPTMKVYEGLPAVQRAYESTLTSRSEICAYVDVEAEMRALPHFFPEYWKRRTAAKIPIRTILVPSNVAAERRLHDVAELRQTRLLRTPHAFTAQLKIWDDRILSIAWDAQIAVLVQSAELARMQKDIFDALWESLPRK
jgi:hypothetical protein